MRPGETLYTTDGVQVCLFPLPILNVTQSSSPTSLSHCCGHPFDCVGSTAGATLYAPCDCTKYYENDNSLGHSCSFVSTKPVQTPSGVGYVSFQFTHGNLLGNGTSYKQGQPIYTTGTLGQVTGDHVHIDQAKGQNIPMIYYGVTCAFGNPCYALQNSAQPNTIFYVNDTTISATGGLSWQTFQGGTSGGGGEGDVLDWIIPVMETNPESTSRPLDRADMENNAKCFYGYMYIMYGWSLNAICGMLGNIQSESTVNPNRWQGDYQGFNPINTEGFGLVQWTPYTNMTDWLKSHGYWGNYQMYGQAECDKIQEELENNEQWIATATYPMSFEEFSKSTEDPGTLAIVFLANYERPLDPYQPIRATQAREWYDFLKDWDPVLPGEGEGPTTKKKKAKWIYYMRPYWKY